MSEEQKVLFVEYCADDFLGGTVNMEPLTELVYRRICDMIYSTNDDLLDNDSLQYTTKAGSKWKKIRKELIEIFGKIYIDNGRIRQIKCTEKLEKSRKNIEQKSTAGKAAAEARWGRNKSLKDIETGLTAVSAPVISAVTTAEPSGEVTNQEPNKERKKEAGRQKEKTSAKDDKNSPLFDPKWFEGKIIRLRKSDYDAWLQRYGGTDDQFWKWLSDRDDWLATSPPEHRQRWFISTSKLLEKLEAAE